MSHYPMQSEYIVTSRIHRWKSYLDQIESQGVPQEQRGKPLDRELLERVSYMATFG